LNKGSFYLATLAFFSSFKVYIRFQIGSIKARKLINGLPVWMLNWFGLQKLSGKAQMINGHPLQARFVVSRIAIAKRLLVASQACI
jgi:hypothetical protein